MIIKNYRQVNKGALVGGFDLQVPSWGNLVIKKCTLFQKDGRRWISFPSEKVESEDGVKYYPYLFFEDKGMREAFGEKVLKAIDEYAKNNQESEPEEDEESLPF